ncbi:uncharacterized protein LOC105702877 [Orussus abietinus]|uniref:uncharacterized protein LOC105702877 n=1 Tax=Orussus abietinus TaxID=222816 RepID=UPI000C715EE3|nr:uncharacterized protein LOC105702877 [Orussus abietinus]
MNLKYRRPRLGLVLVQIIFLNQISAVISGIVPETKKNSTVADGVIDILTSCFMKNFSTIGFAGQVDDVLQSLRPFSELVTVVVNSNSRPKIWQPNYHSLTFDQIQNYPQSIAFQRRLHVFVVGASSNIQLRVALRNIKNTMWWNHEAFFIFFDESWKNSCHKAYQFLWTAWVRNLLNALYLCEDPIEGFMMYTFNPYNKYAPKTWEPAEFFMDELGPVEHVWMMFKRHHVHGATKCRMILFDRAWILDGYGIRIEVLEKRPLLYVNESEKGLKKLGGVDGMITQALWTKLNASVILTILPSNNSFLGYLGNNGMFYGMLKPLFDGTVDIGMNCRYLMSSRTLLMTYPHLESGLCMTSRHRGYESQLTKITTFFSPEINLALLGISLATVFVLYTLVGQTLIQAMMNLLRIFMSTAITHPPRSVSTRIFFSMVLSLFLTLNAIFQGNLSAILTAPIPNPNVDTLADVKRYGLTMTGYVGFKALFENFGVDNYSPMEKSECEEDAYNNDFIVCSRDCYILKYNAAKLGKLHISKEVVNLYFVYFTKDDWPLYHRVSVVMKRLTESGLVNLWREKSIPSSFTKFLDDSDDDQKVLTLREVMFTFHMLNTGLSLATFVFLIELASKRYLKKMNSPFLARFLKFFHQPSMGNGWRLNRVGVAKLA